MTFSSPGNLAPVSLGDDFITEDSPVIARLVGDSLSGDFPGNHGYQGNQSNYGNQGNLAVTAARKNAYNSSLKWPLLLSDVNQN
jgi:hypothetical protein